MKKYGRTIIVIAVLVALGLGYYYYLANKDAKQDATDIAADTSEVSVLISKDIMANYPESPKDVVNLCFRNSCIEINNCLLYTSDAADE